MFFFFQAEDGIRDIGVTGVQTCALPILVLNLGFSHPVEIEAREGIEFQLDGTTKVTVKGINKQLVGNMAADIRQWRKPEPYKGKGIKYVDEVIRRKEGKTGKK